MTAESTLNLCFSTLACPDWSWQQILQHGPQFGYQGVEIRLLERETNLLVRPEFQPDQLEVRRQELDAAEFEVAGLGSSVRFDYLDADVRREQVEIGRRYIDLAHQLHSRFVRVFGDVFTAGQEPVQREQVLAQIVDGLTALGQYAQPRGVLVLMETHGDFAQTAWMQTVMERVNHPAVGVLWDTHHPWRFYNEPLVESFNRLRPWIRHTHWKDSLDLDVVSPATSAATEDQTGAPSRSAEGRAFAERMATIDQAAAKAHSLMSGHKPAHYALFGSGEFPAAEALTLLDSDGYDGWYSLEWEKAWHPDLAEPQVALPDFPKKLVALAAAVRAGLTGR